MPLEELVMMYNWLFYGYDHHEHKEPLGPNNAYYRLYRTLNDLQVQCKERLEWDEEEQSREALRRITGLYNRLIRELTRAIGADNALTNRERHAYEACLLLLKETKKTELAALVVTEKYNAKAL